MDNRHEILISLASKHNIVPYNVLMDALNISNEREFEDFIIHCIYQDVIRARLDPIKRHLEVHDWSSDKLADSDLQFMASTLSHWDKHSGNFLNTIWGKMDKSNNKLDELSASEKTINEEAESIRKSFAADEKKLFMEKDGGSKLPSKPETKRFKSGMKNRRGGT